MTRSLDPFADASVDRRADARRWSGYIALSSSVRWLRLSCSSSGRWPRRRSVAAAGSGSRRRWRCLVVFLVYPALQHVLPEPLRRDLERVRRAGELRLRLHRPGDARRAAQQRDLAGLLHRAHGRARPAGRGADRPGAVRVSVAKAIVFLPMAISFVAAGVIWKFMYDYRPPGRPRPARSTRC